MAARRVAFPRRAFRRRTTKRRFRKSVTAITKRVLNRNLEHKFYQTVPCGSLVGGVWLPATLTGSTWVWASSIAGPNFVQGTDSSTRVGDRIMVNRIEYYVVIQPLVPIVDDKNGFRCRLVCYHNKQCQGAVPSTTGVWDIDQLDTLRNVPNSGRISILRDYVHTMVPTAVTTPATGGTTSAATVNTAGPIFTGRFNIYPRKKIQYISNAQSVAAVVKDDYGVGFIAEGANCCQMLIIAKMHYTDA